MPTNGTVLRGVIVQDEQVIRWYSDDVGPVFVAEFDDDLVDGFSDGSRKCAHAHKSLQRVCLMPSLQRLIQLPRPQQDVAQAVAYLLRFQRLLAHGAVGVERIHDGVEDAGR